MAGNGVVLLPQDAAAIAKASRRVLETPRDLTGPRRTSLPGLRGTRELSVSVKNSTDQDLPAYSIVQIHRSIPTTVVGTIEGCPIGVMVWDVTTPDLSLGGKFGVLQTPCKAGEAAVALLSGVTRIRLDDTDGGDYATPIDGEYVKLRTTTTPTEIFVLGVDTQDSGASDSSEVWGYVLLGSDASAGSLLARITAHAGDEPPYLYSAEEVEDTQDSDNSLGALHETKVGGIHWNRSLRNSQEQDGSGYVPVGAGAIVIASQVGGGWYFATCTNRGTYS